jgi:purine-nucleoside phosphorylase
MPTPHISSPAGAFADTVLMPGDPLRARHIAENYLDGAELINSVRNMEAYTGTHRGRRVSVMGSGMGIPSISIYATELAREYGVKRIMRLGTCGAFSAKLEVNDLVVAIGAATDSRINRERMRGLDFAAVADYALLRAFVDVAEDRGEELTVGPVFSSDAFYGSSPEKVDMLKRNGLLAVEMEAAGLYGVAAIEGIQALAVMTVSDHFDHEGELTSEERETKLDTMITLALETVHVIEGT